MPVIGDCPYEGCGGMVWESEPEPFDRVFYSRHECEDCERVIWTRISRLTPESWTEAEFLRLHNVDDETMQITLREQPEEPQ